MGYPLGKNVNLSSFWSAIFYGLERRYFVLEYRKRHFPGLYWLKKKLRKMAIFGPKRWKNVNSWTFWSSCHYSLKRRFFVLEYVKRHSFVLYCLKKKVGKWPFLDQNDGLTSLEKCQFILFELFVFIA